MEILYDDRDIQPGVKFNDADLIGIPIQIIVGQRNFKKDKIEYKLRQNNKKVTIDIDKIVEKVSDLIEDLKKN